MTLHLESEPEGTVEKAGDALGLVERQAGADLQRFKTFVEQRGAEAAVAAGTVGGRSVSGSRPAEPRRPQGAVPHARRPGVGMVDRLREGLSGRSTGRPREFGSGPWGYVGHVLTTLRARSQSITARYAGDQPRPLPGYLALAGSYTVLAATALAVARRRAGRDGTELEWRDLALVTVSTYRLSRILTKDAIGSPLRAPLTTFTGAGLPGEVNEQVAPAVQGRPVAHAVSELVTCPFCAGQWVATALVTAQVLAPQVTRLVTGVLTAAAGAEVLHYLHAALHRLDAPPRP